MTDQPILAVSDVVKDFAAVRAVARMTFDVQPGEIFALLGPNGAGKSTLLRMLLGLIHPDSGDITYQLDGTSRRVPERHDIGYLPEERGLYQDVGVRRTLRYFGVLRGMTRSAAHEAAGTWLERMALSDRADEPVKALSKGNQQKIQFISAVLHRPRIAVLDEPFSGLDPLNQELFLDFIGELRVEGTTVLLSAHQMPLVERIADRLIIMNRGRTVLSGTIPEIRRKWRTGSRIMLRVDGPADTSFMDRHAPRATARVTAPGEVELFVEDGMPLSALLADAGSRLDIREIETHAVTLHDVYVGSIGADTGQDVSATAITPAEAT